MSPTITRPPARADLRAERARVAADLADATRQWDALDARADASAHIARERLAPRLEALTDQLGRLDEQQADVAAYDALVATLRTAYAAEARHVGAIAEALVLALPDEQTIAAAHVRAVQTRTLAGELQRHVPERLHVPTPIDDLLHALRALEQFITLRLAAPGHKAAPVVPARAERGALDKLAELSRRLSRP